MTASVPAQDLYVYVLVFYYWPMDLLQQMATGAPSGPGPPRALRIYCIWIRPVNECNVWEKITDPQENEARAMSVKLSALK